MRRVIPAVVVAVLVAASLVGLPAATMAQETSTTESTAVAPGAQFAGAVGVQGAELGGDVEARAYGISVARAHSDDARAAVVARQAGDVETRLERLEQRRAALDQARANGSMREGEYRARMAQLHAETRATGRLANQTATTADRLPAERLRANGVDVDAVRHLAERAHRMTGPDVAEMARQIAGPHAGDPPRQDRAVGGPMGGDAGPRDDRGPNASDDRGPHMGGDTANETMRVQTTANGTATADRDQPRNP
jgi:hypothetical protein